MIVDAAPPDYGGAGAQAVLLADELEKKQAIDARIVSRRRTESISGRHGRVSIIGPYVRNETVSSVIFAVLCAIRVLFSKADIVHVHGAFYYGAAASLAARIRRFPVLIKITLLGTDDPASVKTWRKWRLPVGRFVFRQYQIADRVIALNPECRDVATSVLSASKISLIPNGVELPSELRDRSTDAAPRVIFVGEFGERKGGDTLLQAWGGFSQRHPDAQLEILGPVTNDFSGFQHEPPSGVRFLGLVSKAELRKNLSEANIFVLPSRAEGLPNSAIEAMSFGLPVVLSDIPVDVSTALDAGIYFAVGSAEDLDAALERAWTDRMRMGEKSRERSRFFSIERIASEYAEIYDALRSRKR